MAESTTYHRLPEDVRPSMDSVGEDERLLDPRDDGPAPPKKKEFKYSFHPTLAFRFVAGVFYLTAAIIFIVSGLWGLKLAVSFIFVALARQVQVLVQHITTRLIRIRIRIELRESGSSISTKPKTGIPTWFLPVFLQVAIDLLLAILALATTIPVHHDYWWSDTPILPGKILVFIAVGLSILSAVDLGVPSKLTWSGKLSYDTNNDKDDNGDGNPAYVTRYRDVEATGAKGVGLPTHKTRTVSPPGII